MCQERDEPQVILQYVRVTILFSIPCRYVIRTEGADPRTSQDLETSLADLYFLTIKMEPSIFILRKNIAISTYFHSNLFIAIYVWPVHKNT